MQEARNMHGVDIEQFRGDIRIVYFFALAVDSIKRFVRVRDIHHQAEWLLLFLCRLHYLLQTFFVASGVFQIELGSVDVYCCVFVPSIGRVRRGMRNLTSNRRVVAC